MHHDLIIGDGNEHIIKLVIQVVSCVCFENREPNTKGGQGNRQLRNIKMTLSMHKPIAMYKLSRFKKFRQVKYSHKWKIDVHVSGSLFALVLRDHGRVTCFD